MPQTLDTIDTMAHNMTYLAFHIIALFVTYFLSLRRLRGDDCLSS